MNRYLIRKYIVTAIFIVALFVTSITYIVLNFDTIIEDIVAADSLDEIAANIDASINENIMFREEMIEIYGGMNLVLGKDEDNGFDIVRDKEGVLYYSQRDYTDNTDVLAERIVRLEEAVADNGTKVIAFIMPDKYMPEASSYYEGIPYRDGNAYLDTYITSLEKYQIDYFDYRTTMNDSGLQVKDLFYKTDHHWNIDAAFLAYQDCVEYFREVQKVELDPDGFYTDVNNYDYITYEEIMLGSMGRKTGYLYSGLDDFSIMVPRFDTNYIVHYLPTIEDEMYMKYGRAEEALLQMNVLMQTDIYLRDPYSAFLGGIQHESSIINQNNPDGPKVLILMDSYSSPVNLFFANHCSQIDTYWIIELDEDIEEKMIEGNYDYIFISTYVESIALNNFTFFEE